MFNRFTFSHGQAIATAVLDFALLYFAFKYCNKTIHTVLKVYKHRIAKVSATKEKNTSL